MADRIIVVGSLNPEKEVQDRVRVLSGGEFRTKDIRNQGKERRYCRPGLKG